MSHMHFTMLFIGMHTAIIIVDFDQFASFFLTKIASIFHEKTIKVLIFLIIFSSLSGGQAPLLKRVLK
jgi:hypothetical protein